MDTIQETNNQRQIDRMYDFARESGHNPRWLPTSKGGGSRNAFQVHIEASDKLTDMVFFRQGPVLRGEAPWYPFTGNANDALRNCIIKYYMKLNQTDQNLVRYSFDEKKDQIVAFTQTLASNDPEEGIQFYLISFITIECKCDEFEIELVNILHECSD